MPKIIDHEQRRDEIVEVAKRLIMDGGFEAATMRSIVTAAGFANGALKHYFPSKDSIIAATFESVLAETGERIAALDPDLSPREALRGVVEAGMPLDEHRIASGRVLLALWEHSVANPDLALQYRRLLERWRGDLIAQVAVALGESKRSATVGVLADEIISVTIGAHVASLMYPPGELVRRYRRYIDQLVARVAG
jgi:AcrR family transcriptional regulator